MVSTVVVISIQLAFGFFFGGGLGTGPGGHGCFGGALKGSLGHGHNDSRFIFKR
jgi:hypothetical protein